jgi:hypothetical protein
MGGGSLIYGIVNRGTTVLSRNLPGGKPQKTSAGLWAKF